MEKRKDDTIDPQVLTTQEVAQYLRLTEATIYKLAKSGEIPAARVGRTWRFRKDLIDEWFRQQSISIGEDRNSGSE
jgi:excisionase family DNA binding protein